MDPNPKDMAAVDKEACKLSKEETSKMTTVLRTGIMVHLSKSPPTISKMSSNFGKIGLKKMLGGVVLPPRILFSPWVSFSQWTSQ